MVILEKPWQGRPGEAGSCTSELSNNHLITDDAAVRHKIGGLHRGDQVHFRGLLVGYRDRLWGDNWRNSSLTRHDSGNGACEVVFVESIEVLKPGNPLWWRLYRLSAWLGLILLAIRTVLFMIYWFKPSDPRLSSTVRRTNRPVS